MQVSHAGILNREIESIGQRFAHIVVVDEIETIREEHLLEEGSTTTVFLHLIDEIETSVACSIHHSCHTVLNTVTATRRERVDDTCIEETAELSHTHQILQCLVLAMIKAI